MIIKKIQENQISYINAGINMKILSDKKNFVKVMQLKRNTKIFALL
jgi:hypothetical protein